MVAAAWVAIQAVVGVPGCPRLLCAAEGQAASSRPSAIGRAGRAEAEVRLHARMAHIVIEPDAGEEVVRVSEVWLLVNDSEETLRPGGRGTVRFVLPPDALDLELDETTAESAWVDGPTLVDGAPVPPGERQIVLRYAVPYVGTELVLDRTVALPTDSLRAIAVGDGVVLSATPLGASRRTVVEGQAVVAAEGDDLAAGTALEIRVAGLPLSEGSAAAVSAQPYMRPLVDSGWVAVWSIVLAIAGVAVAAAYPTRLFGGPARTGTAARSGGYLGVVEEIARLDEVRAGGGMAVDQHARRRGRLVQAALALLQAESGEDGTP